jgi:anhydro-N-acetylmuramic acid kinase
VCASLSQDAPGLASLIVCGGGAHNAHLMQRLGSLLGGGVAVSSSASVGVPPDQVEALAFAWLAWAFVARQPGSIPAVTGARGPRVLGALYPA